MIGLRSQMVGLLGLADVSLGRATAAVDPEWPAGRRC